MKKVTAQQFSTEIKADPAAQCVDVREPSEHAQTRLENFSLCSLSGLSEHSVSALDKTKRTYLLCRSGSRACQAGERLEKMGFTDLRVIDGGLNALQEAGAAVIQGPSKVWGLERQVRFAAGLLVLAGIIAAAAIHPAAILLSLFVAVGLMFSAVTDTCGMGMVLLRMPWNRQSR